VIVGIGTPVPLKEESPGSGRYGKARVYDPVGNVVMDDLPVRMANESAYAAFWDGRNENGRIVGSGGYLCVVTVTNVNGQTTTRPTKVGVRRQ
jgi:flagellar hook assembly protein FlgD